MGTAEVNRLANANPEKHLDLRGCRIVDRNLSGALLSSADLSGADFRSCQLIATNFSKAILTHAVFIACDLSDANFADADLSHAQMVNCTLDRSNFRRVRRFSEIRSLDSCNVRSSDSDVSFDLNYCRWRDKALSWSNLRVLGQLHLFVPSYVALLVAIATLSAVAFVNLKLENIHDLALRLIQRGELGQEVGQRILSATESLRWSWRPLAVLLSTTLLAIAASLFLFCPTRVREFTLDQWRYALNRSAFEYRTQSWSTPSIRILCAASYCIGGSIALALLIDVLSRLSILIIDGLMQ